MSEYTAVNEICRPRARSKNARIIGNRIVGTGEPEPELIVDAVHEDDDGSVRLEIRLNPRIHAALRVVAKSQNRNVNSTLSRYLAQTISFIASKVDA